MYLRLFSRTKYDDRLRVGGAHETSGEQGSWVTVYIVYMPQQVVVDRRGGKSLDDHHHEYTNGDNFYSIKIDITFISLACPCFVLGLGIYEPAAVLSAVKFLAFTTAFAAPVLLSNTSVVPGMPFLSRFFSFGTETTLMAVPMGANREGINNVLWYAIGIIVRSGLYASFVSGRVKAKKTIAQRTWSSSGVKRDVTRSTSAAERTRSDIVEEPLGSNGGVCMISQS
jgi:hypothetical protein